MFAYCHNNPVIYVDPSGCIIVLADDTTEEQKKEYERAVAYIKTSETGRKLVLLLEESAVVFTIVFVDDNNMSYNTVNKVIRFDPNCGMVVADGSSVQSPAMGLAHEMGHAAQDLDGLSLATGVEREVLEAMNLKYYEIPIAKELGEPIRQKYKDARMSVDMQNSTHFRTTTFLPRLSFWERLLPWNWFRPDRILTEHNLDE